MKCYLAQHLDTGETVTVGATCAEKVGLDPEGLARLRRERNAEIRAERDRAQAARWAQERERLVELERQRSTESEVQFGPHGSKTRYVEGECPCDACRATAPHGTDDRFWDGCSCAECVAAVLAKPGFYREERPVLVRLDTDAVANARLVTGTYGPSWMLLDPAGSSTGDFVPHGRKRRVTVAKRGFTCATVDFVMKRGQKWGEPARQIRRLTMPTVDDWGEPIRPSGDDAGMNHASVTAPR